MALAVTWPWAVKPSTTLMAPIGGDVSTSVAKFEAIVRSGAIPFVSDRITSVGFPDGVSTTPGLDLASAFSALYLWSGSALLGPIAAHGLLAVLGFFLTATVTYLFVRRVTGSIGAGLVAGVAYGFFPHLYLMSWAATTYAHMWLFILPLWGFWNLALTPGRRTALVAGASLVPATFWTPYYTLHAFAVGAACLVVVGALGPRIGFSRKLLGLALAPWAAAVAVYVAIGVVTSFADSPDRPLTDFYEQAAHPLMYVWPGFASTIWGDGVAEALADRVPRSAGANLYVGLSVMALAAFGVFAALRQWVSTRLRARPSPQAVAALLALGTVLICGLCSLPPRVLNGSVPMPSTLIFEVAPGLRAGQRFVMPLMAGMAVLAGLGAHALLRRLPRRALVPATLAIAILVGLDLHTRPPGMAPELPPRSQAIQALARAPDGAAIHILPEGFLGGIPQWACLMQDVHHKTLANTCAFAPPPPTLTRLGSRPICETLRRLRNRGLRYVITEPSPPPPNVGACFRRNAPIGPWRVLARDKTTWVFDLVPRRS
jgi:hypothetical protein